MLTSLKDLKTNHAKYEESYLSKYAARSSTSLGRVKQEEPCIIRNEYQRDRDRVLHSKAFRRLKHKTQVFFSPLGDHYRTRMTHTLEVAQIARTISRALALNEDLTEAIALGHDLGHTPFGHTGESVLNKLLKNGFKHNEQSIRMVSVIEDLNLTKETLDGILYHSFSEKPPFSLEGQVVQLADKIAYLNHDIDDAIRAGIIKLEDIPEKHLNFFGRKNNSILGVLTLDIIQNSYGKDKVTQSNECREEMVSLRNWMFKNVYTGPAKQEEFKAEKVIEELFHFFYKKLSDNIAANNSNTDKEKIEQTVADYIAGMTDRYAIKTYKELVIPSPMGVQNDDSFLFKLAEKNGIN